MDVHLQEMHATGIRSLAEVGAEALGNERLDALLGELGASRTELDDSSAWFSLRFAEAFIASLEEATGDSDLLVKAARLIFSPKNLGPIYVLARAFGTPRSTYTQMVSLAPRVNKVGVIEVQDTAPGRIRLRYTTAQGAPREVGTFMCRIRIAQFTELPAMLFGLPRAVVTHQHCMQRGDEACVYEVRWQEPARKTVSWIALVVGLLVGWSLAWGHDASTGGQLLAAGACGLAAWGFGRVWELTKEVSARGRLIEDHQDALATSAQDNEKRYAELLEAKADVDKQVELRTAELREASAQLQATLEVLREVDRNKTDFFNAISHELRTPLTLIAEPLRMIVQGEELPGGQEAALRTMYANSTQLRGLIDDLLDLAKMDAGAMPMNPAPADAAALVRSVAMRFETAASARNVQLITDVPEQRIETILDPNWVQRALTNLVGNALRHVDASGCITIRLRLEHDDLVLEVEDTGEGIDEADLQRVFQRFGQAKGRRGGTGLGLAIVQEVARLHGGSTSVRSERGQGATFVLRLPRGNVSEATGTPTAEDLRPTSAAHEDPLFDPSQSAELSSVPPSPYPNAPLALVVEDQPDIRRFVALALAKRFRVRTAPNGAVGLELARKETPDIVVSDVTMPVMNGLDLCRALREDDATRSVPVILLTGAADPKTVIQGFDAGANDYILKPFATQELLARVNVHTRLRALVHEVGRRERLATLGTVAASVAHQVRNPLTTLVSGLPAMRRRIGNQLDPSSLEMLDTMLECAERIERTTGDLLDLSRIDRAADDDYKPSEGLMAAVRLARTRVASADVTIEVDVDENPVLRGRPGDMNQVFLNLLDNAVREVAHGGAVSVTSVVEDNTYVVRIGDSGRGIAEEDLPHLFEPFWTTRAAGEGSGLGLSIAKEVVEQHGGNIEVGRSKLGGALFTIRLPLRRGKPNATSKPDATPVRA